MSQLLDDENQLWKKTKRGFFSIIFSRTVVIVLLLAIQIMFLLAVFLFLGEHISVAIGGSTILSIIMAIYLANTGDNPTVKITWIVLVMAVPIFATPLYFWIKSDVGFRVVRRRQVEIAEKTKPFIQDSWPLMKELSEKHREIYNIATYTTKCGGYPVYKNTDVTYFPLGEIKFAEMLVQMEKAERFIFMEYFIIEEGYMWSKILDVLARKSKEGVEVRVMYDGTCAFSTLPYAYPKKLKALGIQCKMYAPIRPFISTHYNNRDHRKILVIDGHTAFTGGINLADEYINRRNVYGHWKDTAIMLKGDAVKSFTMMFLQMWNLDEFRNQEDYGRFLSISYPVVSNKVGYVIPYGDSPLDNNLVGELIYMDIINTAKQYVHIMTPYLIIDGELETALCYAAKRGVDVTLILPYVPDKKFVSALAKNHYKRLLESGVQIYEYTPGFVHAKVFVSDDIKAVVGSINLDYRSLYHHFECAAYLYEMPVISEIEEDIQATLRKSQRISLADVKKEKISMKLCGKLLKLLAPLI